MQSTKKVSNEAAQERKSATECKRCFTRAMTGDDPKDVGANKYTTADKKTIINYNKDKMNNSYEPEGEMIDEMKAPRMQKGAMAYDELIRREVRLQIEYYKDKEKEKENE